MDRSVELAKPLFYSLHLHLLADPLHDQPGRCQRIEICYELYILFSGRMLQCLPLEPDSLHHIWPQQPLQIAVHHIVIHRVIGI